MGSQRTGRGRAGRRGSGVVVSCKREGDPRAEELLLCYSGLGF